jgi:hypothetical protein
MKQRKSALNSGFWKTFSIVLPLTDIPSLKLLFVRRLAITLCSVESLFRTCRVWPTMTPTTRGV